MYVMFSVIVDLWTDNIYSLSVTEIKDYCNVASHESSAVAVVPKQMAAMGLIMAADYLCVTVKKLNKTSIDKKMLD